MRRRDILIAGAGLVAGAGLHAPAVAQQTIEIPFYFPVAVGGPITKLIDAMAADFNRENPSIRVMPIYAGTYQETLVKALTAHKSGVPPTLSVLSAIDVFTLIDEDAIASFDELLTSDDDRAWMKSFFPAFMLNSQVGGKTWGIPFQRSTTVMFWNKELFREAGLDPDKPPSNWNEQLEFSRKLTKKDAGGTTTQWGMQVPSSGFPYWLYQGFAAQAGAILVDQDGKRTFLDTPEAIEALQYWVDLSRKHGVHPPGIVEWGTTPRDFFERKAAMIWTTTGNLTNIKNNAKFPFGVAGLPAGKRRGSAVGGGNFFISSKASKVQQQAAMRFIRWATTPERAAQWSIDTGYVAVSPASYETSLLKAYIADFPPAAVARDQLPHAVAEFSSHENQRVIKAVNDGLQAVLTGGKTPEQALKDAQAEAERILRSHR